MQTTATFPIAKPIEDQNHQPKATPFWVRLVSGLAVGVILAAGLLASFPGPKGCCEPPPCFVDPTQCGR